MPGVWKCSYIFFKRTNFLIFNVAISNFWYILTIRFLLCERHKETLRVWMLETYSYHNNCTQSHFHKHSPRLNFTSKGFKILDSLCQCFQPGYRGTQRFHQFFSLGSLKRLKIVLFWMFRFCQMIINISKFPRPEKGWKTLL